MARLRDSGPTSLPVAHQPRNPQSESIARTPYQIFNGQGVRLDRSTLALWMKRAAWWLKPLYDRQLAIILAGSRVFSDETPMPVLDPGRGQTKRGQFWSHAVDDRPWGARPRPRLLTSMP